MTCPEGAARSTPRTAGPDAFVNEWCAWTPAPVGEEDGDPWVEHLASDRCWQRLAGAAVGRLGVVVDSAPEIYPVNFVLDGQTVVFRSDPGSKLRALGRSPSVCFQVDGVDVTNRTGWSVLLKGRAEEIDGSDERRRMEGLSLRFWGVGPKDRWIRIRPTEVSGRHIHRQGPCPPSVGDRR